MEIIICDDGSAEPTRHLIERLQEVSPVPLRHVWQPDDGFQLARIRNMGMAVARGDYLIQIDGDVIVHPRFVEDYLYNARPGFFFSGTQYHLSDDMTRRLLADPALSLEAALQETDRSWSRPLTVKALLHRSRWNWSRLRVQPLQKLVSRFYHWDTHYQYVSGCSMAFWRTDIIRINGYDEAFTGWGWEDTDLALRLINLGLKLRFIRLGALQFHLYHSKASRGQESTNQDRAMQTIQQKLTFCQHGLQQHLQLQLPDK
ncbi:glycosyltransferase family 2 protein [Spirosoma koreense]